MHTHVWERRLWGSQMSFTLHLCWNFAKQLDSSGHTPSTFPPVAPRFSIWSSLSALISRCSCAFTCFCLHVRTFRRIFHQSCSPLIRTGDRSNMILCVRVCVCVCLPNRKYEPCEQYVEHSSTSKSTNLPSRLRLMCFYYGRKTDESCLEAEKYSYVHLCSRNIYM